MDNLAKVCSMRKGESWSAQFGRTYAQALAIAYCAQAVVVAYSSTGAKRYRVPLRTTLRKL